VGAMSAKIRRMANIRFPYRSTRELCILIIKLVMVSVLAALTVFNSIAAAAPEAVKWTRVTIPAEGEAGNWVLAAGSDVRHLTIAPDGTLYACGQGLTYTLYKSTDGGLGWVQTGNVQDTIVDIAVSPYDADTVYYATTSAVYRSSNGGKTFTQLPAGPGGAGADNNEITSIDVAWLNSNIIAVGTRDTDIAEFGGIYTMDEGIIISTWTDTNIGGYDVYAVAFSPNYTNDGQLVAVITDETDTLITAKTGDAGWNDITGYARLNRDNSPTRTPVAVATPAAIAFPDNYDADPASGSSVLFVAIDSGAGEGDVYKINCVDAPYTSIATDMNIGGVYGQNNMDITGLAALGDYPTVILLAGAADNARTYTSTDGGVSWTKSRKEPTGHTTCVLIAPDFTTTGRMYAATSGGNSALSISRDIGETWNQLSLIDTTVTTIVDLAPSPGYAQDGTLFILTFGNGHSLWRSRDGGNTWERTLAGNIAGVDSLNLVGLPPQYGADCRTVFVAGESNGSPCVWQSTDDGQNYRRRFTRDPDTGAPFAIDTWAIADDNTFYTGSFDGSHGMVYQTTNGGFFYSEGAMVGSQSLYFLALSPGYELDGTILAGNTNGWVYLSSDNGTSFQPLPGDAASPPLTDSITVAFDPEFDSNRTVYAASNTADGGVYRFVIGTDTAWGSIDGTMPAGTIFNGLTVIPGGTLYTVNYDSDGGMERSLNPTYALGPSFVTVTRGLEDGSTLSGLWQSGQQLWSVDTTNIRLMTFYDTLILPATQVSPDDGTPGIGSLIDHTVRNINLDWETLEGATIYQWQCDYETDFSSIPTGFEGTTTSSSVRLPALEPATTYYWRVRASAPVISPWSEKWSFTTSLETTAIALKPESPAAGASGVPIKPLFQWTAVAGANAYEFLVSRDADFSNPAIVRTGEFALPTNAWQCDVSLDYATTYYWKVRATSDSTHSVWSANGVFTTELLPLEDTELPAPGPSFPQETTPEITPSMTTITLPTAPPSTPLRPPSPAPLPREPSPVPSGSQAQSTPYWLIYVVGVLLLTIILALIIILAMVLKIKRF